MVKNLLNKISNNFVENYNELEDKKIINSNDIRDHSKSDIHSWLQYLLIKSGQMENIFSIPEVKIRFNSPIYPQEYGIVRKSKNGRYFCKVDVGFYNNEKELLGVAEVYTMDESHGATPSKDLAKVEHYYLTPYDMIPHMLQYAKNKPKFMLLITILAKNAPRVFWKTKIPYIDEKLKETKNYYDTFKDSWRDLNNKIEVDSSLLLISEEDIERY